MPDYETGIKLVHLPCLYSWQLLTLDLSFFAQLIEFIVLLWEITERLGIKLVEYFYTFLNDL